MTTIAIAPRLCPIRALRLRPLGARAARPRLLSRLAALCRSRPRQVVTMLDILERKYVGGREVTAPAVTDLHQDAAALASIRRAIARLLMRHAGSDRAVTLLRGADKCVRALAVLLGDPAFGKEAAK